jgi:hypothetical protein
VQFKILSKPANNLIVGYNNECNSSCNVLVGSNNKSNTPFVSVFGSNNFLSKHIKSKACLVVGHNNTSHGHSHIFGDNNYVASGLTGVHIFGSGITATSSNTFHIGHHLNVTGLINGIDLSTIQTVVNFTPTASTDTNGIVGDLTYDTSYLYIKTNNGWLRTSLSAF